MSNRDDYVEPFTLPFPAEMSHAEKLENQWKNFRDCPKCHIKKGSGCRSIDCPQLQYAPAPRDAEIPIPNKESLAIIRKHWTALLWLNRSRNQTIKVLAIHKKGYSEKEFDSVVMLENTLIEGALLIAQGKKDE